MDASVKAAYHYVMRYTGILFLLFSFNSLSYSVQAKYKEGSIMSLTQQQTDVLEEQLYEATIAGNVERAKKALAQGAPVNMTLSNGNTLIENLFNGGGVSDQKENMINLLISEGSKLDVECRIGRSYLHEAVAEGLFSTVELLLKKGINPDVRNDIGGKTAIFDAQSIKMLELLISSNAGGLEERDDRGNTLLHWSLSNKISPELLEYLLQKIDVNSKNNSQETPLHTLLGALSPSYEIDKYIQLLLSKGADINARGVVGRTPLVSAIRNKDIETETIELLIKVGADINAVDDYGNSILHIAAANSLDSVKFLINHGANINILNPHDNRNVLVSAVEYIKEDIVKYLLEQGADVNTKDQYGKTALNYALEYEFSDIAMLLDAHSAVSSSQEEIATASKSAVEINIPEIEPEEVVQVKTLDDAIKAKDIDAVKKYYAREKQTADILDLSVSSINAGSLEIFLYFISQGQDIGFVDSDGYSFLHDAVLNNEIKIVEYLLGKGLDINIRTHDKKTGLLRNSVHSSLSMVKLLYANGIKDDKDLDYNLVSRSLKQNNVDIALYFLDKGYELSKEKGIENQPLIIHLISNNKLEAFKFLLDRDMDTELMLEGHTLLHLCLLVNKNEMALMLINAGANVNARNIDDEPLFINAMKYENLDIAKAIYANGGNVNEPYEKSPLFIALSNKNILLSRLLMEKGADASFVESSSKDTLVHIAAQYGYLEIIKTLINKGAKANSTNEKGETPLDIAKEGELNI